MEKWTEMDRQIDRHLMSLGSFYSFVHKETDESEFWYTPALPAFRKLRQEDEELQSVCST